MSIASMWLAALLTIRRLESQQVNQRSDVLSWLKDIQYSICSELLRYLCIYFAIAWLCSKFVYGLVQRCHV
jgi:hypothetical protein